jgi:kanamycin kinase
VKRTEISFDTGALPAMIRQYITKATIFDSSCSEHARTLFIQGDDPAFLKIGKRGSLEREVRITEFLHRHHVAPGIIAYASDLDNDYVLSEAIPGEDGTSGVHLDNPVKLAGVLGEYVRMLHSLPTEGCPYANRTSEMLNGLRDQEISPALLRRIKLSAADNVIIHGDYCLPNIIMDNFVFQAFIDTGDGGIGDRHYDISWGIWSLAYNLKTEQYKEIFLDAYGRKDIDMDSLHSFSQFIHLS